MSRFGLSSGLKHRLRLGQGGSGVGAGGGEVGLFTPEHGETGLVAGLLGGEQFEGGQGCDEGRGAFMGVEGLGAADHQGFFEAAAAAPAGADKLLFLPYLAGERAPLWDPEARGAFIGLSLKHGRAEMARAVAESAGFAMRDVIGVMESLGASVDDLRVTGQPAGNAVWNQIKADIVRKPIRVPAFGEAELMGDLCFALAALGDCKTAAEAAERLVAFGRTFEPDASLGPLYDGLFALYRESYRGLKPVFSGLAAL